MLFLNLGNFQYAALLYYLNLWHGHRSGSVPVTIVPDLGDKTDLDPQYWLLTRIRIRNTVPNLVSCWQVWSNLTEIRNPKKKPDFFISALLLTYLANCCLALARVSRSLRSLALSPLMFCLRPAPPSGRDLPLHIKTRRPYIVNTCPVKQGKNVPVPY